MRIVFSCGFDSIPFDLGMLMLEVDTGLWVLPFVMAAINTRNVHRSHFLLAHAWGADLVYDEMMVSCPGKKARRSPRP